MLLAGWFVAIILLPEQGLKIRISYDKKSSIVYEVSFRMTANGNTAIPDHITLMMDKAWRRELRIKLVLAVVCVAVASVAVLYVPKAIIKVAAFALLAASLFWIFSLFVSWKDPPPFSAALQEGKDMVWIYKASLQMMPFGVMLFTRNRLYIHSIYSEEYAIDLKDTQMVQFLHFLQNQFPKATYGFSRERKEAYRRDPALLLRKRDGEEG